jgi:hypothetical protein
MFPMFPVSSDADAYMTETIGPALARMVAHLLAEVHKLKSELTEATDRANGALTGRQVAIRERDELHKEVTSLRLTVKSLEQELAREKASPARKKR